MQMQQGISWIFYWTSYPRHRMVLYHIGQIKYSFGMSVSCRGPVWNLTFIFRSDFVYMVPPFLAYYGVTTRNGTFLGNTYNQIKLYRSYLCDTQTGMWKRVLLGTSVDVPNDPGFWTTGALFVNTYFPSWPHLACRKWVGSSWNSTRTYDNAPVRIR